jgi:glycosyltransferase involved in cell wall biosynthesis
VVASHPIQYQAPLYRALAARPEIDLHVYFCCRWGAESYYDPGFRVRFSWDTSLLEGYRFSFLRNFSVQPGPTWFGGLANPGIVAPVLRNKLDAIWIHGWGLATSWIAWAAAASKRVPILLRGETTGFTEPVGVKRKVKRVVLKTLFGQIAGFLAIGTNNANFYRSYGVSEEQIFWTPYAVDNDFFIERARRESQGKAFLRKQAGVPANLPLILYCGKLMEKKQPFDLLRAFACLNGQPKASLVFVGDGLLRTELERFVTERGLANVYFLGFRNQTELPACYSMADVCVLPSSLEPWGLVLNEAMCCSLPVIASNRVGAAADLIKQGMNGFTYPVGDVEALTDCLRKVLVDEQVRQAMGIQSRAIISRWGIEEDVEGVLKALHAVTGRRI